MIRTGVPMDHANPERVTTDPYDLNPMVSSVSAKDPTTFTAASERSPAPTLFASGDLPPFTASGVDPQILSRLPFGMRHHAASEPSAAAVLSMVEEVASAPDRMGRRVMRNVGLDDYASRVEAWVKDVDQPAALSAEDAAFPDSWRTATAHQADVGRRQGGETQAS